MRILLNQAVYGPVAANSREPIKLPPYPDPSFDRLIDLFMIDVANKIDDNPVMRKRKREVLANPDLLWNQAMFVPIGVYDDPDLIGVDPFKDKIKILPHDQKENPLVRRLSTIPVLRTERSYRLQAKSFTLQRIKR